MASVDEIFKQSGFSGKRKSDSIREPSAKSAKVNAHSHARQSTVERGYANVEVSRVTPSEEGDEDFGPELPPEEEGDDEDGRFFGGGISKQESKILDYVDGQDAGTKPESIDSSWLRRTALNFEKRITKNAELRAKFQMEPKRFIESEADLDGDIKGLSLLSEYSNLYPEFVKLGCAHSLVGLLSHENTDIAIDVLEVLGELTDDDVTAEDRDWDILVEAILDSDLLDLLVSNLGRLDEQEESDRNGVYHSLGILENLCSKEAVAQRIGQNTKLLQWLLARIQERESTHSQNKQYAAEVLALLAQVGPLNRAKLMDLDVVDTLLQMVALFRKRDPERGSEEEEYMENLFETLTCLADERQGKERLVEAEGVELCLIMLKEGKKSRLPAMRLLDHAAAGEGTSICLRLVDAGGLKTLFTIFGKTHDSRLMEHLLGILSSMLRLLPGESPERIRTLAKFVEKSYEKVTKLVRIRLDYHRRVQKASDKFAEDARNMSADEDVEVATLSRRLDAGLFMLQQTDTILAWLIAEDGGIESHVKNLFKEQNQELDSIKSTLTEQMEALEDTEENRETRDILYTLLGFLP